VKQLLIFIFFLNVVGCAKETSVDVSNQKFVSASNRDVTVLVKKGERHKLQVALVDNGTVFCLIRFNSATDLSWSLTRYFNENKFEYVDINGDGIVDERVSIDENGTLIREAFLGGKFYQLYQKGGKWYCDNRPVMKYDGSWAWVDE